MWSVSIFLLLSISSFLIFTFFFLWWNLKITYIVNNNNNKISQTLQNIHHLHYFLHNIIKGVKQKKSSFELFFFYFFRMLVWKQTFSYFHVYMFIIWKQLTGILARLLVYSYFSIQFCFVSTFYWLTFINIDLTEQKKFVCSNERSKVFMLNNFI